MQTCDEHVSFHSLQKQNISEKLFTCVCRFQSCCAQNLFKLLDKQLFHNIFPFFSREFLYKLSKRFYLAGKPVILQQYFYL